MTHPHDPAAPTADPSDEEIGRRLRDVMGPIISGGTLSASGWAYLTGGFVQVVRSLAEEIAATKGGEDHCGQPAPGLFKSAPSTGWCIRRPGHGVPHRDQTGAEWRAR